MKTNEPYFVNENSIVRKIWGSSDTLLFIFGGASAEFALNKAVDWLYFTGKLPNDPLGRLFSTMEYARVIIFSDQKTAITAIHRIGKIHEDVESAQGKSIPDWAYRDVLYMLIYYSIASFELLNRKMSRVEKVEVFDVFMQVGKLMDLKSLPENYDLWLVDRDLHLHENLAESNFSQDLYRQYRKYLGMFRYTILLEGQKLLVPQKVRLLLRMTNVSFLKPELKIYKLCRKTRIGIFFKTVLLPEAYKARILALDIYEK